MTGPSRRTILSSSVALLGLSAGCIADDTAGGSTDGGGTGDGGTDPTDDESTGTDGTSKPGIDSLPDGVSDYDARAYEYPERSTSPDAALLLERADVDDWLAERDSMSEDPSGFVDETDFETSVLVALEAGAPDPCHEMLIEGIDIEERDGGDDALALTASVREAPDSEGQACIAQETTVGRVARVTFESDRLTTVSASIVDRNGQEHGIGIGSDSDDSSTDETSDS